MFQILIADDERKLRETMQDYLTAKGFAVDLAEDGEEAVQMAWDKSYDLIILDVMMPVMDGFQACREIRTEFDMPILFLSALGEEEDQLKGFVSGADDYIVKPFSLAVLTRKCNAMIRRSQGADADSVLRSGAIELNLKAQSLTLNGSPLSLAAKDFAMLEYLMKNRNRVLTRDQILTTIWGFEYDGDARVVDTHVKRLRKSLGNYASCIKTVIGTGYMFEEKNHD